MSDIIICDGGVERKDDTAAERTLSSDASEIPTVAPETVFELLGDCYRRTLLSYLENASDGTATVAELAAYISQHACTENAPDEIAVRLHHAALPTIADAGLLEYDVADRTVEYIGHPLVEDCLNLVDAE